MLIDSVVQIADLSLDEALALVDKAFDAQGIAARSIDAEKVVEYYRQSERAYRMFHSGAGALHIGLSTDAGDGDDVGHARHVELFAEQLECVDARQVIEFGCGLGYNLRALAQQLPDCELVGVDLSPHHLKSARGDSASFENLSFVEANYQQLDFAENSFDAVLAVETLCQTGDQQLAIAEAYRILRPGGRLMVIDCFRNQPLDVLPDDLRRAAVLVEKTAAVDSFAVLNDWQQLATDVGFEILGVTDHSAETARDLQRLYRLARRFFKMSLAVKLIRRAMPALALENAVCGLLMPYTVGQGAHGYYNIVLEKPTRLGR